jgi:hypothetical protein
MDMPDGKQEMPVVTIRKNTWRAPAAVIGSIIWLSVVIWWTFYRPCGAWAVPGLALNEWGDWAAGGFAPLALLWLAVGYFQQGEELRDNVRALNLQEEQLKHQVVELNASVKQQTTLAAATSRQAELLSESLAIAKRSADAAVNAQRPWLSLKVDIGGEVRFTERGAEIPLQVGITNGGNSPAQHVMAWVAAAPCGIGGSAPRFEETVTAARELAERMERLGTGETLFPNQSLGGVQSTIVPRADIEAAISQGTLGTMIYFHIVVCLGYKFANEGRGRTELALILWGLDKKTGGFGHIDSSLPAIPASELRLQQLPIYRQLT